MRKVTVALDAEVARWARIKAAELDTSISCLVGDMLREKMRDEQPYRAAMQRFLAEQPRHLSEPEAVYPARDELHER